MPARWAKWGIDGVVERRSTGSTLIGCSKKRNVCAVAVGMTPVWEIRRDLPISVGPTDCRSVTPPPTPKLSLPFADVAFAVVAFGTSPENCFFVKNATSDIFEGSLASLHSQVGHVRSSAALN